MGSTTYYIISSPELPTVMQNIGLALITIFIPVALFLFEKNDETHFKTLDKAVILDHLVDARNLLWKVALIFTPILLWDIDLPINRISIVILWAMGVWLVVATLSKSYNWIRKGRFQFRFDYLKGLKGGDELEDLWRSVWESSGTNSQNEIEFFKIFSSLVDGLFADEENIKNLNLLAKLLSDFQIFVQKRSFIFLTSKDDVFQKILEWHFIAWQREYKFLIREDKLNEFSGYGNISSILDATVKSVTERALKDDMAFGFFKLMEDHVAKHMKDCVINAPHVYSYIESLLTVFYIVFFPNIESAKDRFDIWNHYFPKDWLISKQTITNPENNAARVTINSFLRWAQDKIKLPQKGEVEIDMSLDGVAKELFPTVDPFFWGIMLTLLLRPWGGDERIKNLIEYPRSFGYIGRIRTFWGDGDDKSMEEAMAKSQIEELNSSIDLLLTLFPTEFTEEKLKKYISELEALEYKKEEKNDTTRNQVLEYMKRILEEVRRRLSDKKQP